MSAGNDSEKFVLPKDLSPSLDYQCMRSESELQTVELGLQGVSITNIPLNKTIYF